MRQAFFLSNRREVALLRQVVASGGVSFDTVVTTLPGIDLGALHESSSRLGFKILRLEDVLEQQNITQFHISEHAAAITLRLLPSSTPGTPQSLDIEGVDFRPPLLNHVALLLHNSAALELLIEALQREGLRKAIFFSSGAKFALVERLDIQFLLQPELTFTPHLASACDRLGVAVEVIKLRGGSRANIADRLRRWSLQLYKSQMLLKRSIAWRSPPLPPTQHFAGARAKLILIIVRARTELTSIRPVLKALEGSSDFQFVILADDLLKNPDSTAALRETNYPWLHAHQLTKAIEVLSTFLRAWSTANDYRQSISSTDIPFFGESRITREILRTATSTTPELLLFARQLTRAIDRFKPACLITMDMVDRWGALVGELGKKFAIPTLTLQNTSLDKIYYPLPVATSHMIVANTATRNMMLLSGSYEDRISATGLPQYDIPAAAGLKKVRHAIELLESQPFMETRILVATQPFVQDFDYNHQLLRDLLNALTDKSLVTLIIKPHPREQLSQYENLLSSLSSADCKILLSRESLEEELSDVDLLVSRTSTAIQKAVVAGVPSIAYLRDYPADIVERLDYLATDAVIKSYDAGALQNILSQFQNSSTRLQILNTFEQARATYLGPAGNATTAVITRIRDLISRESS